MSDVDLTPFGFTPTENLAFGALLELGPSSGYAIAKALSIARANAYQALNGLVAKGAAMVTDEQPQRFRAVRPDALLAKLIDANTAKLDILERQIAAVGSEAGDIIAPISGRRALVDLALRTLAREQGPVSCLGPADLLAELAPAWHRRVTDGRTSDVWTVGVGDTDLVVSPRGALDPERAADYFGSEVFVLRAGDVVVLARVDADRVEGYWTSDRTLTGLARAAIDQLVSG